MSKDLILKPSCGGCGSAAELYGSTCKHLTLCVNCGSSMAKKRSKCWECGIPITSLIREYNVHASSSNDKKYFIGRFASGLPNFKKNENKWSLQKECLKGRQVTDALRPIAALSYFAAKEKFKNKPWLLEDETGQFQYHGKLSVAGTETATYYLLKRQRKKIVAIHIDSWYNFSKVAQHKQLTVEEAKDKMKNRRRSADDYQRWMMKAAHNGAAAFAESEKFSDRESAGGGRSRRKETTGDDDEANVSDGGEENEDKVARTHRLGLNKKSWDVDEEDPRGGDFDDDDIEKGDDWEHEEIFTDDDEAVEIDPQERKDLAPDIPSPPEIKQDDDEADEAGGLSKCGKEMKKLLRRSYGLNEYHHDDMEDDTSPVAAPKKEAPTEEPVDNSPLRAKTSAAGLGTPSTSKSSKGKRKISRKES